MAARHGRLAPVGEYQPPRITASGTDVPVGSATHGTWLGSVTINQAGTGATLTLFNGNPSSGGVAFAAIVPVAGATYSYNAAIDNGLYYTLAATTPGDYTINFLDMPV